MTDKARRISLAEQRELDGGRQLPANFVPAAPQRRADLPAQSAHSLALDVTPTAQQIVHVETSATDRARGYTIALVPLAIALGVLAVLVTIALFDVPFLSFTALIIFWLSFALCWLAGWVVTLLMSAEGVAFFEANRKWKVIEREQAERWAHWRWQSGRDDE